MESIRGMGDKVLKMLEILKLSSNFIEETCHNRKDSKSSRNKSSERLRKFESKVWLKIWLIDHIFQSTMTLIFLFLLPFQRWSRGIMSFQESFESFWTIHYMRKSNEKLWGIKRFLSKLARKLKGMLSDWTYEANLL